MYPDRLVDFELRIESMSIKRKRGILRPPKISLGIRRTPRKPIRKLGMRSPSSNAKTENKELFIRNLLKLIRAPQSLQESELNTNYRNARDAIPEVFCLL